MKLHGLVGLLCLAATAAAAQQPAAPGAAPGSGAKPTTCQSQYAEAPAYSSALLISTGFEIKAAVPGGLWLQKDKDVYYCNAGRTNEREVMCWKLRIPVKGQPCSS